LHPQAVEHARRTKEKDRHFDGPLKKSLRERESVKTFGPGAFSALPRCGEDCLSCRRSIAVQAGTPIAAE
jgi:hypothetical protein